MLGHILLFFAGLVCGLGTVLIWQGLRFAADLKAAKHATAAELFLDAPGERDRLALAAIDDCKRSVRRCSTSCSSPVTRALAASIVMVRGKSTARPVVAVEAAQPF
jgi:hypothetical protein